MTIKRKLIKTYTPQIEHGFLGSGHTALPLVMGDFTDTDPFIALMDDNLDKKDNSPAGGPHPHAGFETVSLLVDGKIVEMLESMKKGDFQIMTAGSGIVHTETINAPTSGRLFQLWLNLPKKDRRTTPRLQILPAEHVPISEQNGINLRLYSGSLDGLSSPIQNYVPLIVAEISMKPELSTILKIPANFNTFLVAISGSVEVGENEKPLTKNQVGWLDKSEDDVQSELLLKTGAEGARLVLYSAKTLGEHIVSKGPFIADSSDEIQRLYQEYRAGKMKHISTAPESQRITY
jgi:redox-sensitive bicupin YhaK (pirin superfamily)